MRELKRDITTGIKASPFLPSLFSAAIEKCCGGQAVRHGRLWGTAGQWAETVAEALRPEFLGSGTSSVRQGIFPRNIVVIVILQFCILLQVMDNAIFVHKGVHPDIDSYSAFWDNNKMSQTTLAERMREKKITDLYVCGLAYDVCVGATAKHSLEHGYRTILVEDGCRGISVEDILSTRDKLVEEHAVVVNSSQVVRNFLFQSCSLCFIVSFFHLGQGYGRRSGPESRAGLLPRHATAPGQQNETVIIRKRHRRGQ